MKKIIIILLPLLLTGCTINYNLEIDENGIEETITGSVEKSEYEIKDTDSGLSLAYTLINDDVFALINNTDLYTKNITNTNSGIDYKYNFIYNNNFTNSRLINTCFENHMIIETDEYYDIQLGGEFYCLYSDKININVTSNNAVLNHNANKVEGNKYSWTISDKDNADIILTISKTVEYQEMVKAKPISKFQLIGLIIFLILTVITYFLYKKKNSGTI